jgi:hypothetical protein
MLKLIKQIIIESSYLHKVTNITEDLYINIFDKINKGKGNLKNVIRYSTEFNYTFQDDNISVNDILIDIVLKEDGLTLATFNYKNSFVEDGELHRGELLFVININDLDDLKSIISHELVHVYQHIKTNGKRKEYDLNIKNKKISLLSNHLIWKEFSFFIYFTLNLEINARIHQIISQLKNKGIKNFGEINMEEIRAFMDFKRAEKFNPQNLLEIENIDELIIDLNGVNSNFPLNKNKLILFLNNLKERRIKTFKTKLFKSLVAEFN